jgi:predicted ATPase/class 3 adenylate cyclase
VTIMFADITGSTPLADRLDPEDMRAILTGYFNLMTEQIRKHGGTVEKYIGDAVMAVFGIPIAHEDDPDRAIRAALDMQDALAKFNDQRISQDPHATRLQMRIGINTGEVASPSNSTPQRLDFLITGDAVNVAARLQQAASPDTILVGERTYLTTRDVFEFRQIAPLHVRGKSEPIEACIVVGLHLQTSAIAQHPRGIEGQQARLVGRSLELTLMHANYARVQAERHPHLITILGTPGIGKSRLVREFIAREQDKLKSATSGGIFNTPKVVQGRCPPYGEGITYWPLIEILRSLLQVDDEEDEKSNDDLQDRFVKYVAQTLTRAGRSESNEEIASTIMRSVGGGLSGSGSNVGRVLPKRDLPMSTHTANMKQSGTQVALLRAWRVFLEALAEIQPLIIVVDDLQWADEALLDLLEYLTDRITEVPILFLCPARPDFFERRRDWGGGRRNFTTIELEALTREESSELIDTLLNADDLPEVVRNTILTRAEGNPFFVEEIVRMFIDQGFLVCEVDLDRGTKAWRLNNSSDVRWSELTTLVDHPEDTLINAHYLLPLPRVPDTIQGVLAARVDLLNSVEKLILQHAAIIGRTFWLSSLLELAEDMTQEAVQNALDSLIFRDFIVETEKQIRSPVEHDLFYIFKHVLIRDVVYNNIPRMRRSQEHARLALWLEEQTTNDRETYAELLAYHYQQAVTTWSTSFAVDALELFDPDQPGGAPRHISRSDLRTSAIKYLTLAGDQALHSYYTIRALQAYNDAFDLLSESNADAVALIAMYIKLGDAYSQRGNQDEAWQHYRKALRLATAEDAVATVETTIQIQLYERMTELGTRWLPGFDNEPDAEEIRSYLDAGLQLLKDRPISRQHAAFLTYEAFWFLSQLDIAGSEKKLALAERALASGQEALRLAEQLDDPIALSLTLDGLGVIYSRYHKYNEAHRSQHRRQQLENRLTDRDELYDIYTSLGRVHEYVADYPTALMWFGRAWSNAQTMESPVLSLSSMVFRMRTWRQWNRWDDAVQVARDILRLIEQYQQDEKRQLWALETLATIAYRRGNQEDGDQYSRQYKRVADQQFERSANSASRSHSTSMHAIHLAREDWQLATADYKEKLRLSEPLPSPEVLATLAELLVVTGEDPAVQASICERAVLLTDASGARKNFAIALRARGRMYSEQHEWKLAEDDLRQSLQHCEVLDLPWEHALTLYHLGRYYKLRANSECEDKLSKRTTDLGRARYHFEQARGFFASLKALPSVERIYQELAQDTLLPI